MRKIIIFTTLIACFLFIISSIHSKTTIITDDPAYTTGETSAILDVKSTARGLIIPRMTEKARNDILLPATGLLIFQTDADPGFYFNAGTPAFPDWQRLKDGTSGHWMINGDDIYYMDGNVGIGTDEPDALLHTYGTGAGEGNVLFVGTYENTPGDPPAAGAGIRMMWYPDKAAFRAGRVTGTQWDKDNIGNYSVAMGHNTTASENYATAMGSSTIASGTYTTAMGYATTASGNNSTAMGFSTISSGYSSTVLGHSTTAKSSYETVLGIWNTDYTPGNTFGWNPNDRLFVIGNGVDSDNRSNAMTVLKNGNVGLGTDAPDALFHTYGTGTGEGNVLFVGTYKDTPGDPPVDGAGTRMMWYPDKAAFRAGRVTGTQWDKDNIGNYSVAMGHNTSASGPYNIAMGNSSTASGLNSTAMGDNTSASGSKSTAMGIQTSAFGWYSTAMGANTIAKSGYETVIGRYNIDYTPFSSPGWNSNDRLFVIGNGVDSDNRSNAMTVLKNGNTGFGTHAPAALLHTYGTGTGEGNVLFVGSYKDVPGNPPATGSGTRMMWFPDKAAFRAGRVTGTHWNNSNIGTYSTATGYNTIACGMVIQIKMVRYYMPEVVMTVVRFYQKLEVHQMQLIL